MCVCLCEKQFQEFERKFLHKKRKPTEVFVLADNLTNKMEFEPLPLPNHMGSWEAPMPGAWEATTGSGVPSWDRSLLGEEPKVGNLEAFLSDYFLVYTCLTYWPNLGEPALSRIWCLQLLGGSKGE